MPRMSSAASQARIHCQSTMPTAYLCPSSRRTEAMAATQGVYRSENTSIEAAAKGVSVVGEFNGWREDASPMSPVATTGVDDWSLGARNWRYVSSLGYGVTLGNTAAPAPAWHWGDPAHLAGIGLYTTQPDDGNASQKWRYAVAAGALDSGNGSVASGGLNYGPVA